MLELELPHSKLVVELATSPRSARSTRARDSSRVSSLNASSRLAKGKLTHHELGQGELAQSSPIASSMMISLFPPSSLSLHKLLCCGLTLPRPFTYTLHHAYLLYHD